MQLVQELNRSLQEKNFKRAYNIFSRMQARDYPQVLLETSLKKIQSLYKLARKHTITYGFQNSLEIDKQDIGSVRPHKFYSHIDEITSDLKVTGWCYSGIDMDSEEISFLVVIAGIPYRIFRTSIFRGDISGMFRHKGHWGYEFMLPSDIQNMASEDGALKVEIKSPYGESFDSHTDSKTIYFGHEAELKIFPIAEKKELDKTFGNLNQIKASNNQVKSISIILLNLNGGDIVIHSIQSIIEKMRPGDELIVVDHGSNDSSVERIKQFGQNKNIIVWEREKNHSFSGLVLDDMTGY